MNRLAFYLCLVAVGCSNGGDELIVSQPPSFNSKSSELSFEKDLGNIVAGQTATHQFAFENKIGMDLKRVVDSHATSCGCTTADVDKVELLRNLSAVISVRVKTTGKDGPFSETVSYSWLTPTARVIKTTFLVRGNVQASLRASPSMVISFNQTDVDSGTKRAVRVSSELDLDWRALRIWSTEECILHSAQPNETGCDLEVWLDKEKVNSGFDQLIGIYVPIKNIPESAARDENNEVFGTLRVLCSGPYTTRVVPRTINLTKTSSSSLLRGVVMLIGKPSLASSLSVRGPDWLDIRVDRVQKLSDAVTKIEFHISADALALHGSEEMPRPVVLTVNNPEPVGTVSLRFPSE